MKTFLAQFDKNNKNDVSDSSLSSLGSITSRRADWDSSTFSLSSQSNIDDNCKQLWIIRHGERMDEVATEQSRHWRFKIDDKRCFDPPLTTDGYKQARDRGKLLINELSQIKRDIDFPKCIYVSPTERTLGTAYEIAMVTKLPIVVIPGLSACAAAVKRGGLIKKKVKNDNITLIKEAEDEDDEGDNEGKVENNEENEEKKNEDDNGKQNGYKDTDDFELFLNDYGWIGTCNFLTKKEILQQFGKNGVDISFDYRFIEKFKNCVERLIIESGSNTILCVSHREGIRKLDGRLKRARIPYCALAKYAIINSNNKNNKNPFDFVYFEDEKAKLN